MEIFYKNYRGNKKMTTKKTIFLILFNIMKSPTKTLKT